MDNVQQTKLVINEEKIFSLKLWLGLGRLVGATQYGLLGTIFVVWLTGVLGKDGIGVNHAIMSVMGTLIMVIFSSSYCINIACRYPYRAAWAANAACMISGIIMLLGFNPWIILTIEATIVFVMDAGFLRTRKAMMHRKLYGDALTKMNNQLDIISNGAYLLGSILAMVVPETLEAVGITIMVAAILLLPLNLMQIKVLVSMPDLPNSSSK